MGSVAMSRDSSVGGALAPSFIGLDGELRRGLATRLIEAAPSGGLLIALEGRIVSANGGAAEVFGYGRDELVGLAVDVLVPEMHRARCSELHERHFASPGKRDSSVEARGVRKDGSQVFVDVRISRVSDGDLPLVLTVVRDVTDEVERKQRLEEYALG